jgi:hypothetical protein
VQWKWEFNGDNTTITTLYFQFEDLLKEAGYKLIEPKESEGFKAV